MPLISIVIPSHRRPELLTQAIASCLGQLGDVDLEVIVVHDGPDPVSQSVVRSRFAEYLGRQLKYFEQPKLGSQQARNIGFSKANGQFIKFLDDDDYLQSGALRIELKALDESKAAISYGVVQNIDAEGKPLDRLGINADSKAPLYDLLVSGAVTTHPLRFLVRRELASEYSWDPTLPARQDLDYFVALARMCDRSIALEQIVGHRREHAAPRISWETRNVSAEMHLQILLNQTRSDWRHELTRSQQLALHRSIWAWARIVSTQNASTARAAWHQVVAAEGRRFTPMRTGPAAGALRMLDWAIGPQRAENVALPFRRAVANFLARRAR